MRLWYSGCASDFQSDDEISIISSRSREKFFALMPREKAGGENGRLASLFSNEVIESFIMLS